LTRSGQHETDRREYPALSVFAEPSKLGPYQILASIGASGMGEVYRARDTRLGRELAIKVSTEHFSERFERETRAIAALNHPKDNMSTIGKMRGTARS